MINLELAKERGLSSSQIVKISQLQSYRAWLLTEMKGNLRKKDKLAYYGELMSHIESELQKLWGFDQDVSMTKFWELPACTCPKMDNEDRMGSGSVWYDESCPVHSYQFK